MTDSVKINIEILAVFELCQYLLEYCVSTIRYKGALAPILCIFWRAFKLAEPKG